MHLLAEKVGFRSVAGGGRVPEPAGPICFHLIDYRVADGDKQALLQRLRSSPNPDVRFAPLIVVVNGCPAGEVASYVRMGFDDVITLPGRAPALAARLETQLNRECIYFETATYFGPDRRGRPRAQAEPTRPPGRVVEHHFIRDPLAGTRLLRQPVRRLALPSGLSDTLLPLAPR